MADKKKVIIDADVGTDDAVAITAAILADHLEILAITCVHGNRGVEFTTKNTLRLVDFLGEDIPVYSGCPQAMTRGLTRGRIHNPRMQTVRMVVDGKEIGIHDEIIEELPPTTRKAEEEHACSYLINTLRNADEKITLIALGPLTNIGMALRLDPGIIDKIEAIYIMGGGIERGNRTPVAEANFYDDPEAAQIVLQSGAKIVLCPLEPCSKGGFDSGCLARYKSAGNKVADFIVLLAQNWKKRMRLLGILPEGSDDIGMCDWGAVAPVIDPSVITDLRSEICEVDVSGGIADGMLVFDRRIFAKEPSNVSVIYGLDTEKMSNLYEQLLKSYRP